MCIHDNFGCVRRAVEPEEVSRLSKNYEMSAVDCELQYVHL